MAVLVMKFGGTSVADIERIRNVARHVAREHKAGNACAVVVSAMAGHTNQLVAWMEEAANTPPDQDHADHARHSIDNAEYDHVVSSGELVTSGLLAQVLKAMGVPARSWAGWQIPMRTSDAHARARITAIPSDNLKTSMARGEVAVIAGFQGIADNGRVTTLGRGGSDTTAVAIAAALDADQCDIYTDVDGVYTTDPRIVAKARRIDRIAYEEMLEMASLGAKVLQTRSVELAMAKSVPLMVRSSFDAPESCTPFGPDANMTGNNTGTLVCSEEQIMEEQVVTGIAYTKGEAKITLLRIADKPGLAAAIFGPLAIANINVDMIVQNVSADGQFTDLTFTIPVADHDKTIEVLEAAKPTIGYDKIDSARDVVKVSVIGVGMRSHAGVAATMFKTLADHNINILAISTSEIKISVLIHQDFEELAMRVLHTAYGLDAD